MMIDAASLRMQRHKFSPQTRGWGRCGVGACGRRQNGGIKLNLIRNVTMVTMQRLVMDPHQQEQQQQQQQNAFAVVKGVGDADVALASLCT